MKPRILVIDDERSLCDFLAYFLQRHGFQVATTLRGLDGLRLLDEQEVQLVILDVVLGDCDGLDLLSKIKNSHPNLPVLMLTGLGYQEDLLQDSKSRGASGYLSKSMAKEQLLMEVRRLLSPAAGLGLSAVKVG